MLDTVLYANGLLWFTTAMLNFFSQRLSNGLKLAVSFIVFVGTIGTLIFAIEQNAAMM